MIFSLYEADDGNTHLKLDLEGIGFLQQGLEELSEAEPGATISSPSLDSDGKTSDPLGVSDFVLERA